MAFFQAITMHLFLSILDLCQILEVDPKARVKTLCEGAYLKYMSC